MGDKLCGHTYHNPPADPRAQPLGILEPKGQLIVKLASVHNTDWCHPLTHHLLSDNLWYLPVGPEFFPLYSATIFSLAKCLSFSKVVLQGGQQKISAPKKFRPFVLGVPWQCMPASRGISWLPQLVNFWTLLLVCCWIVCIILSPPSLVSFLFLPLKQFTFLLSGALTGICVRKYQETILISGLIEIEGKRPSGQDRNHVADELGRFQILVH